MDIVSKLQGWSRGLSRDVGLTASNRGSLYVSQTGLPYARWTAEGKGFRVIEATATAGVAALPTTTAGVTLQNGEDANGLWYVIHSVFCTFEASAAAVETAYIAHVVGTNAVADATNDLGSSIKPLLGGGGLYGGKAIVDLAATVVDDLWNPATSIVSNAVASNGEFSVVGLIDGAVILKPGAQYSLEICATSTSVTGRLGVAWFEVEPNELL